MTKYGDYDNVTKDVKTLNGILERQGITLLLEVIAESIGNSLNRWKSTDVERNRVRDTFLNEFKEALNERI